MGAASDSMCLGLAIYALCHVGEAIGELTGIPGDCDASSLTLAGRPRCDADVMMCNVEVPCAAHHASTCACVSAIDSVLFGMHPRMRTCAHTGMHASTSVCVH